MALSPLIQNTDRLFVGGFAITPSDSQDLTTNARGIMVGTQGDLHVIMGDGSEVTWPALAPGVAHPLLVRKVFATGTSATGIRGGV